MYYNDKQLRLILFTPLLLKFVFECETKIDSIKNLIINI